MAFTHWQLANESNFGFVAWISDGVQRMKPACPDFGRTDQRDEKRLLGEGNVNQRKSALVRISLSAILR